MRTIIIGDIHGCIRPFSTLLDAVDLDMDSDMLILLGDLLDRGPDSRAVLEKAQELDARMGERLVLLLGNHEDLWLQPNQTWSMKKMHNRVGRQATVQSFGGETKELEEQLAWLPKRMVPYYRTDAFQCAHAGVKVEPVEMNDRSTLIHDHDVALQNRYAGKLTIVGHVAMEEALWLPGNEQPVEPLKPRTEYPLPHYGTVCLDTGCGKGGCLTGMVIENGHFTLYQQSEKA